MIYSNFLSDFITKNIDVIDANDFSYLYYELYKDVISYRIPDGVVGEFTAMLIDSGIDFFNYINYVPEYCFCNTEFTAHVLPDHFDRIANSAFLGSDLEEITCSKHLEKIEAYAFQRCPFLHRVVLYPINSIFTIEPYAFAGCIRLNEITFMGTKEQWEDSAFLQHDWSSRSAIQRIVCIDGIINIGED